MDLFGDSILVSPAGIIREKRGGLLSASTSLWAFSFVKRGLNKVSGGRTEKFSLFVANSSLRRRLRGLSLAGGGVVWSGTSNFSRLEGLRYVRLSGLLADLERLSLWGLERHESSVTSISSSESDASVSDNTRGDPTNGASRLSSQALLGREVPRRQRLLFILSLLIEFFKFQIHSSSFLDSFLYPSRADVTQIDALPFVF